MRLTVIGSGSDGNTYLAEIDNEVLVLDCGCPAKDVKVALNFDISKIIGCVISHSHG